MKDKRRIAILPAGEKLPVRIAEQHPGVHQVGDETPLLYITKHKTDVGMSKGRMAPVAQLSEIIRPTAFFGAAKLVVIPGYVLELVDERMRDGFTGTAAGGFRAGDDGGAF